MKQIHEEVLNFLLEKHEKDKKFLFTIRQLNRYSKLDEGFWFLGNKNYLAVSFWSGTDTLTRTPRVYFKINKSGETSLQLKNKDLSSHTDYFHPTLIENLALKKTRNGYEKKYSKDDYLESLDFFLNTDKVIIDNYVNSSLNEFSVSEWSDPLCFLDYNKFKLNLKNIENYRRRLRDGLIPENNFLKELKIKNFGSIKDIHIENLSEKSNWIFLTGENGSGKTTILKAIATAICRNSEGEKKISEEYDLKKFTVSFSLHDGKYYPKKYVVDQTSNSKHNDFFPVDGFAAYGAVRLLTENTLDKKLFKDVKSIKDSRIYGLFSTIGILNDMSNGIWLDDKSETYDLEKDALIGNLEQIIPNISIIEIKMNNRLLFYENEGDFTSEIGKEFTELPSGTRNFVALILDLLIKLRAQQPGEFDPANYKGIVLIDEIDIHLHPKMQIELVKQLSATFPHVQFIVSTHSPIPILGAPENSVFLKVERDAIKGTYLKRLSDLEENFQKLLPTALLTSDLFDLEQILNFNSELEDVNTNENYNKFKIDELLNKELNILKNKDLETFKGLNKEE